MIKTDKIKEHNVLEALRQRVSDLEKLETEYKQERERYRTIFESVNDVIVRTNLQGKIIDINKRVEDYFGYKPEEIVGRNFASFGVLSSRNLSKISELFGKAIKGNLTPLIEIESARKDGSIATIEVKSELVRNDGKITGIVSIVRDITERTRVERELRQEKEKLQKYFEIVRVILVAIDANGKVSMINDRGCQILGYERDEILGKDWISNFIPEKMRYEVSKIFNKIIAGKIKPAEFHENPVVTRKGEERIIAWHNTVIKDNEGNVNTTLSSGEDVTERRQMEQTINQANARYRTLFEQSRDAIYITTREGKFVDVNQSLLDLLGYTRKEIAGMNVLDIYTDASERLKFQQQIEQAGYVRDYDIRFRKTDGTVIDCLLTATVNQNESGEVTGYQGIIRDVTGYKQIVNDVKASYEKLQKVVEGAIETIASIAEVRDPYTAGHQQRVAKLASAIAKKMKLPEDQIVKIRIAGILHDIGKVSIPAELLSKPGKLNKIEFDLIKTHPQVGREILKTMELPWQICHIVLQHHERLDGSGYPKGLSGNDISLEARILAVADVVEAMASHRPYRPSLGIEKALEEISANKGILYDSNVVDACIGIFRGGFKF